MYASYQQASYPPPRDVHGSGQTGAGLKRCLPLEVIRVRVGNAAPNRDLQCSNRVLPGVSPLPPTHTHFAQASAPRTRLLHRTIPSFRLFQSVVESPLGFKSIITGQHSNRTHSFISVSIVLFVFVSIYVTVDVVMIIICCMYTELSSRRNVLMLS